MKQINIEEAADWSDEEAAENLAWLRDRPWRYDEVNRILELRGGEPDAEVSEPKPDLDSMKKADLYALAEQQGFEVNSDMTKAEIIEVMQG